MNRTSRGLTASSIWFAAMVGGFAALAVIEVVSPGTLDDLWSWIRGLAWGWQALAWFLTLPWLLALAVWESSWDTWLRALLATAVALSWLIVSLPRRPSRPATLHWELRTGHPHELVFTRHGIRHVHH